MKDMVNFAGMIAADILRGDMPASHWSKVQEDFLLHVRKTTCLILKKILIGKQAGKTVTENTI